MEVLLVRKKSESEEVLNRAAKVVDQGSIIGIKERKLIKDNLKNFHGFLKIHLYGSGNITKKLLFLTNSPAANVISWPGIMEIGVSA
ncbi:MAG: hypothetical protein WC938_01920 [Candidatus Paceibacterota bacterium]|jgi:hypothetical protein